MVLTVEDMIIGQMKRGEKKKGHGIGNQEKEDMKAAERRE